MLATISMRLLFIKGLIQLLKYSSSTLSIFAAIFNGIPIFFAIAIA